MLAGEERIHSRSYNDSCQLSFLLSIPSFVVALLGGHIACSIHPHSIMICAPCANRVHGFFDNHHDIWHSHLLIPANVDYFSHGMVWGVARLLMSGDSYSAACCCCRDSDTLILSTLIHYSQCIKSVILHNARHMSFIAH